MKKILISTSKKINFFKKIFFNKVYLYPNNNIKDNQNNKGNIRYISPDFIDLRETFLSENNAAKFSKEILSLPIYPELHETQQEYIINSINKFYS